MLLTLSPQYKFVLAGSGILSVIVFLCLAIIIPQQKKINELKLTHNLEQQKVLNIEAYARKHPDADHYLKELDKKLTQLDEMLPRQPAIGAFMTAVEAAADSSGVRLIETKPLSIVKKSEYREIPLEITARGSYWQMLAFLKRLENMQRFNSMTNVTVRTVSGIPESDDLLECKLLLVVYTYDG
ncbi:MAG TPA: type 4a pilus biogenesis protein PilO [Methylomusa anaerophila]|nr:type 4a pilus biogenesis protein PilO [Methylomusa anaerophila]HML86856.1 type 4a pilus biogenesis protein PilO [Methylomusa anaerophila]